MSSSTQATVLPSFKLPTIDEYQYMLSPAPITKQQRAQGWRQAKNRRGGMYSLRKRRPEWRLFEERVRTVFQYGLEFEDVPSKETKFGGLRVDVAGGKDGTFVCALCRTTESGAAAITRLVRDIAAERSGIERAIRRKFGRKYTDFRYIVAIAGPERSETISIRAREQGISVWTEGYIEAVETLFRQVGPRARHYVFRELGCNAKRIRDGRLGRTGRYIALSHGDNPKTYTFVMPASELLDLSYVYRIQSGNVGAYQRMLIPRKLKQVAEYLSARRSFKNNIIVNLDRPTRFRSLRLAENNSWATVGILEIPRYYCSVWVIDGQHRLYGYARLDRSSNSEPVIVTAIQSLDPSDQAQLFVDINENQKPVDPNIVWTLYTTIQTDRKNYTIAQAVKSLATFGPLKGKVYVPDISSRTRRHYKIFIANLCSSIVSSGILNEVQPPIRFEDGDGERMASLLRKYLTDLEIAIPASWRRDFFWTNNGLSVLLILMGAVLKNLKGKYESSAVRRLVGNALSEFCAKEDLWNVRTTSVGGSGRMNTAVRIEKLIARLDRNQRYKAKLRRARVVEEEEDYDVLRNLETRLRACVMKVLQGVLPEKWWPELVPERVVERGEKNKASVESTFPWNSDPQLPPIYYIDFAHYAWIIDKNWSVFERVFRDKDIIRGKLREPEPIRNQISHNRPPLNDEERDRLRMYRRDVISYIDRARL